VKIIVARFLTDDEAPRQLAVALARAGRYDAALKAAAELRHEQTLMRIARVLAEDGYTQRALDLLDSLSNEDETACEHVAVLSKIACSNEGLVQIC
jgi:hypothetical protein